jgi:uncharacterized protein with NRDE domain
MCTVTYIPSTGNGYFLTSNRDEKKIRLVAQKPVWYLYASGKILFPKDGNAGGTWMALHENGNAMVLLNGATQAHQYLPPYRKSRGVVFLDIFDHPQPLAAFDQVNLHKIEPFTLVIRQQQYLFLTRWDGMDKTIEELDPAKGYIWSSSTLYSNEVIRKRKEWFDLFLTQHQDAGVDEILNFHRFAGDGDETNDVLMNRNDELFTVSITQLYRNQLNSLFQYYDLQNADHSAHEFLHQMPVTTYNDVE